MSDRMPDSVPQRKSTRKPNKMSKSLSDRRQDDMFLFLSAVRKICQGGDHSKQVVWHVCSLACMYLDMRVLIIFGCPCY